MLCNQCDKWVTTEQWATGHFVLRHTVGPLQAVQLQSCEMVSPGRRAAGSNSLYSTVQSLQCTVQSPPEHHWVGPAHYTMASGAPGGRLMWGMGGVTGGGCVSRRACMPVMSCRCPLIRVESGREWPTLMRLRWTSSCVCANPRPQRLGDIGSAVSPRTRKFLRIYVLLL